ncbi:MAG: pyridoxal phosphate-dependent aminotransferase [Actinomycetota bacterium]
MAGQAGRTGAGLSNTEMERLALTPVTVNLSDGHARMPLDRLQQEIVDRLPTYFDRAAAEDVEELESRLVKALFRCTSQEHALRFRTFLTFSASSSLKMAAQVCRMQGRSAMLIEPVFDNIRHLLGTEEVPVVPLAEQDLVTRVAEARLTRSDSIWLVSPNNPTGWTLAEADLRSVAHACARSGALLVIDASFRPHSKEATSFDTYAVLAETGTEFIGIEDTGKTWATHDLKVGVSVASPEIASTMHRLHDQLLLNVSPIVLALLADVICDTSKRGLEKLVRAPIAANRRLICDAAARAGLRIVHRSQGVPLVVLDVSPASAHKPRSGWQALRSLGIDALPLDNYYWSGTHQPNGGEVRLPLSRSRGEIELAAQRIAKLGR